MKFNDNLDTLFTVFLPGVMSCLKQYILKAGSFNNINRSNIPEQLQEVDGWWCHNYVCLLSPTVTKFVRKSNSLKKKKKKIFRSSFLHLFLLPFFFYKIYVTTAVSPSDISCYHPFSFSVPVAVVKLTISYFFFFSTVYTCQTVHPSVSPTNFVQYNY